MVAFTREKFTQFIMCILIGKKSNIRKPIFKFVRCKGGKITKNEK